MSTKKNIKARQKKIIKCLSYIYKKRKLSINSYKECSCAKK